MFENCHGESCARVNVNQRIREDMPHTPRRAQQWKFLIFCFLLFGVPAQCLASLEKIWVDGILHAAYWNEFLSDRRQEWEKTMLPVRLACDVLYALPCNLLQATVLLSANVGLLAIQSVDSESGHSRNLTQIASYASVILCLTSYLISHILSLKHSRDLTGEELETDVVSSCRLTTTLSADAVMHLRCLPRSG